MRITEDVRQREQLACSGAQRFLVGPLSLRVGVVPFRCGHVTLCLGIGPLLLRLLALAVGFLAFLIGDERLIVRSIALTEGKDTRRAGKRLEGRDLR